MYECVDCTKENGPVLWHNPDFLVRRSVAWTLAPLAASLHDRLAAWIRGENLLDAANQLLTQSKKG
jgi:hypothetical protein